MELREKEFNDFAEYVPASLTNRQTFVKAYPPMKNFKVSRHISYSYIILMKCLHIIL